MRRISIPPYRILDFLSVYVQVVVLCLAFIRAQGCRVAWGGVLPVDLQSQRYLTPNAYDWNISVPMTARLRQTERRVTHSSLRHVISRSQACLEKEHVGFALRDHHVVNLDGDVARRREDVDALVGVFGVAVYGGVFFVPGIWTT